MVLVKLVSILAKNVGAEEISISASSFTELLKELSKLIPDLLSEKGVPSQRYIILVNDRDYRVYEGEIELKNSDTVIIIPVIHGG